MLTDLSAQPQPGRDLDGHAHPDDGALDLDAQFIAWHLPHRPWLLDQLLWHLLSVLPTLLQPVLDGALIEPEGADNRWHWAALREQRHHQRDHIRGLLQTIKDGPGPGTESLATLAAAEVCYYRCLTLD